MLGGTMTNFYPPEVGRGSVRQLQVGYFFIQRFKGWCVSRYFYTSESKLITFQ